MSNSSPPTPPAYLHGTAAPEQRRLAEMNRWINAPAVAELRLQPGLSVLDVGSGLGQLARMVAREVSPGRVVGVEVDPKQLAECRRLAEQDGEGALVDFRAGDATTLPLSSAEWGSFDLVHTRFVLEHVADPLAIVRQMVRAARPGGRIVLQDDDHALLTLHPAIPSFDRVWKAYMDAFRRNQNDPLIGRRLVELLHTAGAAPRRNTLLFFGSCAGSDTWELFTSNLAGVIETLRPSLLRHGLVTDVQYAEYRKDFEVWSTNPAAAAWYGVSYAEGVRPNA